MQTAKLKTLSKSSKPITLLQLINPFSMYDERDSSTQQLQRVWLVVELQVAIVAFSTSFCRE